MENAKVRNQDVLSLDRRLSAVCYELRNQDSANITNMTAANVQSAKNFSASVRAHLDWINGAPVLNLPHAIPTEVAMPVAGVLMENNDINDLLRLLEELQMHACLSDSARLGSGLQPFDYSNFSSILDKVDALIVKIETDINAQYPEGNVPGAQVPGNATSA